MVGVHDVITPFKFGDDRSRGFWLAKGQSFPFPIDFEGRPYNTHTTVWGVIYVQLKVVSRRSDESLGGVSRKKM